MKNPGLQAVHKPLFVVKQFVNEPEVEIGEHNPLALTENPAEQFMHILEPVKLQIAQLIGH